jgi:hypothetical protein
MFELYLVVAINQQSFGLPEYMIPFDLAAFTFSAFRTTFVTFQTPALLTSTPSPLTCASNLSTSVLFFSSSFRDGLASGLGMSRVFDLLGRNGIGVDGLDERNYDNLSALRFQTRRISRSQNPLTRARQRSPAYVPNSPHSAAQSN